MIIFIEKDPARNRWWVHMDMWVAGFRSLDAAESFVERLNSRINAPHAPHMIGNYSLKQHKNLNALPNNRNNASDPKKSSFLIPDTQALSKC